MRRAALLLVILAFLAVSCGSSSSMSGEAADALQGHMEELRSAVEQEKSPQAEAKLNELRAEARARADDGEITADRLAQIEAAATQVENFLDELGTQPPPEPTPTPEPSPEPEPTPEPEEEEEEPEEEEPEEQENGEADQGDEGDDGEQSDGGPGKEDGEGPGDTSEEGDQTDGEPAGEDETDTARATWAVQGAATAL